MPRINPVQFSRSRLYLIFTLVLAAVTLSDCVRKTPPQTARLLSDEVATERAKRQKLDEANQNLKEALTRQTAAYQQLEEKIAMLQLRLLKKEIQIKELNARQALLQKKLEEAIQDVVRTKAKLRSLVSKAEAASNMAEAEVALKDLKARSAGKEKDPEVIQAEYLLKMSAREFEKKNYGGALYLASQVKSLAKMGQAQLTNREKMPMMAGEALFSLPVPLQVLRKGNVREGPGLDFKVLFTLDKGAPVIGHSYKGQWVRVKSEDSGDGWIFHTLVDGR